MKRTILKVKNILYAIVVITTIVGINLPITQAQNQDPLPAEVVNAIAQKTIVKFNNSSCPPVLTKLFECGLVPPQE
ncbi:hypothetical protein [Crocosphaera sp. XPORK-15E]|uniref:hypothetical protein n=1 Tax=Crocosphaera sp. XPORK-15E TaxID=3110247 RepID=UPI002B1FC740|nr:hypothetical protein [Crocosphaera sp. XPORK-15E]MEA5532564.1 hypothetical protein [Crocosphaera sp. XPORK-15E]